MKYNTPTEEEMEYLASIKGQRKFGKHEIAKMYALVGRLLNIHVRPTTCGACISTRHKDLMAVYNAEINKKK